MHLHARRRTSFRQFTRCYAGPLLCLVSLAACSSETTNNPPGDETTTTDSGGLTQTNSVTNTVGTVQAASSNSTSSSVTSSASSSVGTTGSLGTSSSVSSVSTTGTGELTTTGVGGMTMTGGTDTGSTGTDGSTTGGKPAAMPSAGCSKMNPATGSSQSPLNVANHQYYVKLPTNYDPDTPYPVIFMFHPTNNPLNWAEQNAGFERNGAKDGAIRVYPGAGNNSAGWGAGDVSFFEPLYDQIIENFCVDQARMFAAGESSGGDFVSILGCEHADKLRAVAPCATKDVPAYPLNAATRNCTGQVTAVVIHGKMDNVVGTVNGPLTRDFYVDLNHCGDATQPHPGYTDSMSNCIEYTECDPDYPVFWCQHSDPEYGGTNHGWPRFAADMLWELFSSY